MSANLERSGADVAMPSTAANAAAVLPRPAAFAALFAALLGLLAGQRFLLPIVSAFICLVPLALAVLFWRKPAVRNSMTCLALLSKVDSSSIAYGAAAPYAALMVLISLPVTYLLTRHVERSSVS